MPAADQRRSDTSVEMVRLGGRLGCYRGAAHEGRPGSWGMSREEGEPVSRSSHLILLYPNSTLSRRGGPVFEVQSREFPVAGRRGCVPPRGELCAAEERRLRDDAGD